MKFYGKVGYGTPTDLQNGIWEDTIVERNYYGDVIKNTRRLASGEKLNDDITVGNDIEIVADPYAENNFFAIRYVEWRGVRWVVSDVEVRTPRLLLRLGGGVYNGPRSTATP